jgi:hypothetical protein
VPIVAADVLIASPRLVAGKSRAIEQLHVGRRARERDFDDAPGFLEAWVGLVAQPARRLPTSFGDGRTRLVSAGMAESEAGDSEYGVSVETRWRSTVSVALMLSAKVTAESSR